LSGSAIDQTSFLNVYGDKASFQQEVIGMVTADIDGL
jgi:hypothetical protein